MIMFSTLSSCTTVYYLSKYKKVMGHDHRHILTWRPLINRENKKIITTEKAIIENYRLSKDDKYHKHHKRKRI
jgi:hypothetical protein